MKEKEKNEEIKLSCNISENGEQLFIFDENSEKLLSRTNFYETGLNLSNIEKKEIGETLVKEIFSIVINKRVIESQKLWENKCEAFKEAYDCSDKTRNAITWLLTTILGITMSEAIKRYNTVKELRNNSDFKNKEELLMEKIYLNKNNISNVETIKNI